MEFQTDVLLTVIRESVSLFILLVFLTFSYRLLDRFMSILDETLESIATSLRDIAEAVSSKK